MATPTREELIDYALKKGVSAEVAAAKADAYLASKLPKAEPAKKPEAPKSTPKPATSRSPEPPKPSPAVAAQVPRVGAKTYGAEPPPSTTRDYSDTVPPVRSRAASVMPGPSVSLTERGGLWLDRKAAAEAQAEDRAKRAVRGVPPAMVEAIDVEPVGMPKSRAPEAMRFSDMGYGLPSIEKMRAELMKKAKTPADAENFRTYPAEDVTAVYAKVIGG